MIELLVIDLDGTLIRDDLTVGTRTLEAIEKVKRLGIQVTFATGRMIAASLSYAKLVDIQLPMIALNGALVKSHKNGDLIWHSPISSHRFEKLFPALKKTSASATIVNEDEAFGWNIDDFARSKLASWIVGIKDIEPNEAPYEPTIAMVAGQEEPVKETAEIVSRLMIEGIQFFLFPSIRYYPMWYFEVRSKSADKGAALRALRENLSISRENVMVIGDYVNDIPMFFEAGYCATVANAHEDVKRISDYISPLTCNEDGVAEIIERLLLR